MKWLVVLLGVLQGCGGVSAQQDASSDVSFDALDLGPWSTPSPVAGLADADVRGGSLTADRLEFYFTSSARPGGQGGFEIWRSTRAATTAAWRMPSLVSELNSPSDEGDPFVSLDGLSLWFSSNRLAQNKGDIYVSVRASRTDPWGVPQVIASVNTVEEEGAVTVTDSGLLMVFASRRNGGFDVFSSNRASVAAQWGTPVPIAEVNGASDDFGVIAPDGLRLMLTSPRPGGIGGRDIYRSTRSTMTSAFADPIAVHELNSDGQDEMSWISADDRYLLFTRLVRGGAYYQALEASR